MTTPQHSWFKRLAQKGTLETLPKGFILYDYYTAGDYVYCLIDGICALMSIKECGKENIYHYLKPGSLAGLIPAYTKNTNHSERSPDPYFVITAKSKCKVYKLHHHTFFQLLTEHPEMIEYVLQSTMDVSRSLLNHFYTANESNAASKLAFTLLTLAEDVEGESIIHKEFNYTELAKYLGIHPITVSRIMGIFKEKGIIKRQGHRTIITDQEQLMVYSKNIETLHY